jgi:hypothetical protein
MEATSDDWLEETHVASVGVRRLARTVAVYGANAGGKSNLLLAMSTFREFLKNSSKNTQLGDRIPVTPFRLHTETERAPSHFEFVFAIDDIRYRYGFEATSEAVISEWLFSQADSIRETTLFTREGNRIEVGDAFREGRSFEKFTRHNALFLSVVAQFNGETAGKIMGWMLRFKGISGISDQATLEFTVNLMSNSEYAPLILNLIRQADVGIESLKRMEVSPDQVVASLPKGIPDGLRELFLQSASRGAYSIRTLHRRFDSTGQATDAVEFDLQTEESAGTQKLVAMAGPFLHTLREGSVLFVDELEARLHPLLTKALEVESSLQGITRS